MSIFMFDIGGRRQAGILTRWSLNDVHTHSRIFFAERLQQYQYRNKNNNMNIEYVYEYEYILLTISISNSISACNK